MHMSSSEQFTMRKVYCYKLQVIHYGTSYGIFTYTVSHTLTYVSLLDDFSKEWLHMQCYHYSNFQSIKILPTDHRHSTEMSPMS